MNYWGKWLKMSAEHLVRFVLILCLILLFSSRGSTQSEDRSCNTYRNDTLFLCAGTLVQIDGQSKFIRSDTLITPGDAANCSIVRDPYRHSVAFYDSLRMVASRSSLMLHVFDILVPTSRQIVSEIQPGSNKLEGFQRFEPFSGMKIRKLVVEQLDVFGPTLTNPGQKAQTWLGRTGNKLHMTTRKRVILENLFVQEGDTVDPVVISENAQLLRSLPYFEEAALVLVPVGAADNEVDLFVITKDLFSFGIYVEVPNIAVWDMDVYNHNFLGLGHRVSSTMRYNTKEGAVFSISKFSYRVDNIRGTFVNAETDVVHKIRNNSIGIRLFRDFFSVGTKVAGGLELYHQNETKSLYSPSLKQYDLRLNQQVLWLGQAFRLGNAKRPLNLVFAAALQNKLFTKRPYVDVDSNQLFHNSSQIIGSVTLSRNFYYTGNYIYQFGRTEDIPYGFKCSLSFGPDAYEYSQRYYSGLSFAIARYINRFGYLSGRFSGDGYWTKGVMNQGYASVTIDYFSPLQYRFFNKVRHFLTLKYATGIRRLEGESFHVVKELGVGGLSAFDTLYFSGNQKITSNFTSMVFTPVYYYGFKLAWFAYANLAWIGPEPDRAGQSHLYSGFGFGCMLRNENLVLKTIKLRAGFYPGLPENKSGFLFEFSGVSSLQFLDFRPKRPQTLHYE